MSKKHNVYITTPPVEVIWTYIDKPDEGRTHNGRPISDGMRKATMVLDPNVSEHAELLAKIEETNQRHYDLAGLPEAEIYNRISEQVVDGKKTGKVLVTAKSQFEIDLLDAQNMPIPSGTYVGWGSVCNLKLCLRPTTYQSTMAGSTISLNGMRIIKLVQRDDYGDPVEDGFSGDALRAMADGPKPQPEHEFAGDFESATERFNRQVAETNSGLPGWDDDNPLF